MSNPKLFFLVTVFWMTISCGCVSFTWSSTINSIFPMKNGKLFHNRISTELLESIASGVQMAIDDCKSAFKWDRWNCPESAFSRRRQHLPTKEQALVRAIVSAGVVHEVTRNCSRGQLKGCGCDAKLGYATNIKPYITQTVIRNLPSHRAATRGKKKTEWSWGGCSDDVEFGQIIAQTVLDELEQGNDSGTYMNLRNNYVGRMIVKNTMKRKCRCHGLSGSCSLKTCWMQVAPFSEIATLLRERYRKAIKMDFENSSNNKVPRSYSTNTRKLGSNRLIYLEDSPNYCIANSTTGWMGTKGRMCSRSRSETISKAERRSCRNLCRKCGHRVRKNVRQIAWKCNCTFKWCCEVQCDVCTKFVDEFFCD